MAKTNIPMLDTASRIAAGLHQWWHDWMVAQEEAAQHMFQRSVEPLHGRAGSARTPLALASEIDCLASQHR
jgi:hypothetical protein